MILPVAEQHLFPQSKTRKASTRVRWRKSNHSFFCCFRIYSHSMGRRWEVCAVEFFALLFLPFFSLFLRCWYDRSASFHNNTHTTEQRTTHNTQHTLPLPLLSTDIIQYMHPTYLLICCISSSVPQHSNSPPLKHHGVHSQSGRLWQ